jgi:hypothetical protein
MKYMYIILFGTIKCNNKIHKKLRVSKEEKFEVILFNFVALGAGVKTRAWSFVKPE